TVPAAVVAGEMWESHVRCGISKRGGNGGKVGVGLFHGSHGASFPQPRSGFWAISARMSSLGTLEVQFLIFQNPRQMHIFPDSCGEPDKEKEGTYSVLQGKVLG